MSLKGGLICREMTRMNSQAPIYLAVGTPFITLALLAWNAVKFKRKSVLAKVLGIVLNRVEGGKKEHDREEIQVDLKVRIPVSALPYLISANQSGNTLLGQVHTGQQAIEQLVAQQLLAKKAANAKVSEETAAPLLP